MGVKKTAVAIFCGLAYLLLAVLIVCSSSGKVWGSCVLIGAYTNALTSIYSFSFTGKKSFVMVAGLAVIVNIAFLILRIKGIYLAKFSVPSTGEVVGSVLMIGVSLVWLFYSIRRNRNS